MINSPHTLLLTRLKFHEVDDSEQKVEYKRHNHTVKTYGRTILANLKAAKSNKYGMFMTVENILEVILSRHMAPRSVVITFLMTRADNFAKHNRLSILNRFHTSFVTILPSALT